MSNTRAAEVTQVVWTGKVTWRHLALLSENQKFRDAISRKLELLGYSKPEIKGIESVTTTIEDLVISLEFDSVKEGKQCRTKIHVKMDGLEISFPDS